MIVGCAMPYKLMIANTCFKRIDEYFTLFKSGLHDSQIDSFFTRRVYKLAWKDCKVILERA